MALVPSGHAWSYHLPCSRGPSTLPDSTCVVPNPPPLRGPSNPTARLRLGNRPVSCSDSCAAARCPAARALALCAHGGRGGRAPFPEPSVTHDGCEMPVQCGQARPCHAVLCRHAGGHPREMLLVPRLAKLQAHIQPLVCLLVS